MSRILSTTTTKIWGGKILTRLRMHTLIQKQEIISNIVSHSIGKEWFCSWMEKWHSSGRNQGQIQNIDLLMASYPTKWGRILLWLDLQLHSLYFIRQDRKMNSIYGLDTQESYNFAIDSIWIMQRCQGVIPIYLLFQLTNFLQKSHINNFWPVLIFAPYQLREKLVSPILAPKSRIRELRSVKT